MKKIKKLLDPDFLLNNSKKIVAIISCGIILCLVMIFIVQSHSNLKEGKEAIKIKEATNKKTEQDKKADRIAENTISKTFEFENLSYDAPDIGSTSDAFKNTTDELIGSYKNYLLFSTTKEDLYFYNVDKKTKTYVTDMSIYNQISGDTLFYVELLDQFGSNLNMYNIDTKETEPLTNLTYKQTIGGVGKVGDVVYYIITENGKSHLQAVVVGDKYKIGANIRNLNLELPIGSYMIQEGNNLYVINKTGYYVVKDSQLQRVGDTPQLEYNNVKMYKGAPIIYGFDEKTQKSQLVYKNKVVATSDYIFSFDPINEKYFLINDDNHLRIVNIDTLTSKEISDSVGNSIVTNGSLFFNLDKEMHNDSSTAYYYFKKK